jgi:hypothetical protein
VAAEEPVTSPDQNKPTDTRAARFGAVAVAGSLVLMAVCGNHKGHIEDIFLVSGAAILIVIVLGDWLLRKNGLR